MESLSDDSAELNRTEELIDSIEKSISNFGQVTNLSVDESNLFDESSLVETNTVEKNSFNTINAYLPSSSPQAGKMDYRNSVLSISDIEISQKIIELDNSSDRCHSKDNESSKDSNNRVNDEDLSADSDHEFQVRRDGFINKKKINVLDSDSEEEQRSVAVNEEKIVILDESRSKSPSNDDSVLIVSEVSSSPTDDFVGISSDEEFIEENKSVRNKESKKLKQTTITSFVKTPNKVRNNNLPETCENHTPENISTLASIHYCTPVDLQNQRQKVNSLRQDLYRTKNILQMVGLSTLPDKGASLFRRIKNIEVDLQKEEKILSEMKVDPVFKNTTKKSPLCEIQIPTWEKLQHFADKVEPNGFGKQALGTYNSQKTLTMDRLQNLHGSLSTCPNENVLADDPTGLKVSLMPHQKHALAWLMWREGQKPPGGILADDMGLGKTLTMISLILKKNETQTSDDSEDDSDCENDNGWKSKDSKSGNFYNGGTLVVCPASLINQWEREIDTRCRRGQLIVEMYHGTNRNPKPKRLSKNDVVLTTYTLVIKDFEKNGPLFQIKWRRIILDEAHIIRNHKTRTSQCVFLLKGKYRWTLTGTPIHNKEFDMYSLMKFIKCSPFDDLMIWKKWIANNSAGGQERLHTVMKTLMLRRTKAQLKELGTLTCLPEKTLDIIEVVLDKEEMAIYQKVLVFSKTLLANFLHQRAEKNSDIRSTSHEPQNSDGQNEYTKMYERILKHCRGKEVKSHEILVLLLRLRQICCHPCLIKSMFDEEVAENDGIIDSEGNDIDVLRQLEQLTLYSNENEDNESNSANVDDVTKTSSNILNHTNPLFDMQRKTSKIRELMKILKEKIIPTNDKAIIVSQWTSMLDILKFHLDQANIKSVMLSGKVPLRQRMTLVNEFNSASERSEIMLLSLNAGGVGLNLTGANHLLLFDLHWNPQLESQAQDRIFRVGQKKTVKVYKFVSCDTIEERIKALQDKKLSSATEILTGVKQIQGAKLSIDDIRILFNM